MAFIPAHISIAPHIADFFGRRIGTAIGIIVMMVGVVLQGERALQLWNYLQGLKLTRQLSPVSIQICLSLDGF